MRFLVIEDDEKTAKLISNVLSEQAYQVDIALTGMDGETKARGGQYDAIVLDLLLPDYNGVQLCRNLRRRRIKTPILMLTGLDATELKVEGLDAGADDYLSKPFEIDELIARVRALLRRARGGESSRLTYANVEMDLVNRRVTRGGKSLNLTTREFALLELLLRHAECVLSKEKIGQRVWAMETWDDSNVIEVYVSRLRSKLDQGFASDLIHTVVGAGYVLSRESPAAS
jgi:two-component system copper resistance phosphate regulon response regulator CusR